jgi:CBS domain-containing membrane protein
MYTQFYQWFLGFLPAQSLSDRSERLRATAGALLGIFLTGALTRAALGPASVPMLIAPMGASAVLLFAVPASPLAQPWSVVGGNVIAAIVGVTVARQTADPLVGAAFAVALTVGITASLRCLHPPAGAVALTAVVGGPAISAAGYGFVFAPVAINTLLLLGVAIVFNNGTRQRYPHRAHAAIQPISHRTTDPPALERVGFTRQDVSDALRGKLLDVTREDLDALLAELELRAHRRLNGIVRCADIMSRDIVATHPEAFPREALAALDHHRLRVLPVIDAHGVVVGVVDRAALTAVSSRNTPGLPAPARFETACEEDPIDTLLPVLARGDVHEVMIVSPNQRLLGIVTQTDVLAALYRARMPVPLAAASAA